VEILAGTGLWGELFVRLLKVETKALGARIHPNGPIKGVGLGAPLAGEQLEPVAVRLAGPPGRLIHEGTANPPAVVPVVDDHVFDGAPGTAPMGQARPDDEQVRGPGDRSVHGRHQHGAVRVGGDAGKLRLRRSHGERRLGEEPAGELRVEGEQGGDVGHDRGTDLDAHVGGFCAGVTAPRTRPGCIAKATIARMDGPSPAISYVIIDCIDPERLASFWATLLGRAVAARTGPYVWLSRDQGLGVGFQRVAETKSVKNRVHLDLATQDLVAARERVEQLGGRRAEGYEAGGFLVMLDPEGNEFCLIPAGQFDVDDQGRATYGGEERRLTSEP